jgi:hypothetical protein
MVQLLIVMVQLLIVMVQPKNTTMIIYQYLKLIFHFDRYGATFEKKTAEYQ